MKEFKPSTHQIAYFDWIENGKGNCVLEAVAGAGKTTTLLEGLRRMSGTVWIGVFNKKMSDELKEKISMRADLRSRTDLKASTFHSAGFNALRFAFGKERSLRLASNKLYDIAARKLEHDSVLRFYKATIASIVSMAKNRGIGAVTPLGLRSVWEDMIYDYNLVADIPLESASLDRIISYCISILTESNNDLDVIDFDDMIYLPIEKKLNLIKSDWVLVDEAQDTNPVRRALAVKMIAPNGRFVAVGDPRQAIFGFTGADNDSLDSLRKQFNAITLPLSVSYRCPKKVVEHARQWVSHIESHPDAKEGSVDEMYRDEMFRDLCSLDRELYKHTAVLCRTNRELVSLCLQLIRRSIPAKMEGRDIGKGLIKLIERWQINTSFDELEQHLENYKEREVTKAMNTNKNALADFVTDQVDTILVLIDRARELNKHTIPELKQIINDIFTDDVSKQNYLTMSSVHRSKGLEWDTVYLLGREELMPSRFARKDWEREQEINLIYVAVTRAKNRLIEVSLGIKEEKTTVVAMEETDE